MSAPVLSGDLRAFPLPDILLMISTNHKSGILRCLQPGATKSVEWEDGEIVFARSSMPGDRLGAFLLARGAVSAAQIQQASPMVGTPDRLGKALIRIGALTPSEMWNAVQGQIKEIVYSLFHWREGQFEFREGPPASEKIALDINVMNLIMEGTRRLDEWSRVKEKIQNDRVVLAPLKSTAEMARSLSLSDFETVVLSLVDGRRTVRDIVVMARRGEFETWQALHVLLSAGLVRIQLLALDPAKARHEAPQSDDEALDRTIGQYGGAISMLLERASATAPGDLPRLRKLLRDASFDKAELLKEIAVDPEGRIDRRILLANVADYPPGQRARLLQGALERLLRLLIDNLRDRIPVDDISVALGPAE
ncbi:MAG TPA: DUF4388 domain-containing protein [Candidatus Polarisedimenticolia bacterium]|jgi:hypothetical protein|nr:DUF4388 domain-containing protein [Candidatus Polarisedimenticolia bacterium]